MAKVRNPTTFSKQFGISPELLDELGVLNPTLSLDTKLFIDPLLLSESDQPEMQQAATTFQRRFEQIITLLARSRQQGDVAWRNAERLLHFPEIAGTCIGYGASSIRGSAFGPDLRARLLQTAHDIVKLGIDDPDLFLALALFEADVGPDRISDLTTNVILPDLIAFNNRVLEELRIPREAFDIRGLAARLPRNPLQTTKTPIILLPADILRDLPIAADWDDIGRAAAQNEAIRGRINDHVSAIWEAKSRRDKDELKQQVMSSRDAFQALLDAMHAVAKQPYDVSADPRGIVSWADAGAKAAAENPLAIVKPAQLDLVSALDVVRTIVQQFRHLVENGGLNEALWRDGRALPERYSQLLFFAVAYAYCKANDLDLSPEVDSGNGEVDFKISRGFNERVLVEVKLSNHNKVIPGYTVQLEAYKAAEETTRAVYLVMDVGRMGRKDQQLIAIRNEAARRGDPVSDLEFVDAKRKPSASKR